MTDSGIRTLFGAITAENARKYRINASVVPLKIDQKDMTNSLVLSGGMMYSDDGASIRLAGSGVIEFVVGDVYESQAAEAALAAIKAKTDNLPSDPAYQSLVDAAIAAIPAAPSAASTASAVRAELAVELARIDAATTVEAGRYRFGKVAWAPRPFEGRHAIAELEQTLETGEQAVPAGSWLVPMDQPKARLAALLLEPASPDSFLRWGFFDAIFEEKEYAEPRVMEAMAREMMAKDPALKAEFEAKLAADAAFAADPRQRLRFFYQRTPYFDTEFSRYPVLRLDADAARRAAGGTPAPPRPAAAR
jgi:hypothetical protein